MATHAKCAVVFGRNTGLSDDNVVNDFYARWLGAGDPDATDLTNLANAWVSFYNDAKTGMSADLASRMSEALSRSTNAARVFVYTTDTTGPPAVWGSPDLTKTWTLDAAAAGTPLPSEMACALSFHADLTDIPETEENPTPPPAIIRPASRRRGRVFIGPLQAATGVENSTTHEFELGSTFIADLATLGSVTASVLHADWQWAVASKTGDAFFDVDGGWVDWAYDVQRRRGSVARGRTTF